MELTRNARAIKNELASELRKNGSSLEELENALSNINTGEGVLKVSKLFTQVKAAAEMPIAGKGKGFFDPTSVAAGTLGYVVGGPFGGMVGGALGSAAGGTAASLSEAALKGSMGAGALAGLTFDEMDKSVEDINKALDREREKIHLVKRITNNLKREHGLQ
jgi:hypothetical protein